MLAIKTFKEYDMIKKILNSIPAIMAFYCGVHAIYQYLNGYDDWQVWAVAFSGWVIATEVKLIK